MYGRKPAPAYVPSPTGTPGPGGRPLPSPSPNHLLHQHQQPYSQGTQQPYGGMTDDEAFELGYPDREDGGQALHQPGGYGGGGGGAQAGQGGYGVLPQGAYDDHDSRNPFADQSAAPPPPAGSYGHGGYGQPSIQLVNPPQAQQQPAYLAPPPPQSAFSPPPPQSTHYYPQQQQQHQQLPANPYLRAVSPQGPLSAFEATLASFRNPSPQPPQPAQPYYPQATSPPPPPQHQQNQPFLHPSQPYDPENYAGYDTYTANNRYGENNPSGIRSRSPTPPLEDDIVDDYGGPSPNLSDHFPPPPSLTPTLLPYSASDEKAGGFAGTPGTTYLESPMIPSQTQHFGPAPEGRLLRRHKTKRRVKLQNGNLVVEAPVPTRLAALLPVRNDRERSSTTYTAITCDPDDFVASGFSLRQALYERKTEIFIVITMYSENEVLFLRTLYGVMKNISHLCKRTNSKFWGKDGWKKVVVAIVADGRAHIHPKVLDVLTALGVYREGLMKNTLNGVPVQAHLFEYTTSFALDPDYNYDFGKGKGKEVMPCQIIFCLKENNAKKINSHRWFFNAFAPVLEPNVCMLLDVGTRPGPRSIYKLWKVFDNSSNVGGACGEIAAYKAPQWRKLLNPLVASQNFEYKMSNILDKPTESAFGYISVLPGAFSAYRYIALTNGPDGLGPLQKYFLGETLHGGDAGVFTKNMYLAEDRILCFELICARKPWVLRYVQGAVGETDVPEDFTEFILQRRRWLNGSLFATCYALWNTGRIWRSEHSVPRKLVFMVEAVYNFINLVFSWFAIANFYIFFVILTTSLEDKSFHIKGINVLNVLCQYLYIGLLVACFLFSMGNRPKGSKWKYMIAICGFSILTMYMLVAAVLCAVKAATHRGEPIYSKMIVSILSTYGVYFLSSVLALDPWHLITSFLPYTILSSTYVNILSIYAFANLHDFTWGTKGSDTETPHDDLGAVTGQGGEVEVELPAGQADVDASYEEALLSIKECKYPVAVKVEKDLVKKRRTGQEEQDYYANFRTNVLLLWVLTNAVLAAAILSGGSSASFSRPDSKQAIYMLCVLIFVAATSVVRFLGSTLFLLVGAFTGNTRF